MKPVAEDGQALLFLCVKKTVPGYWIILGWVVLSGHLGLGTRQHWAGTIHVVP